MMEKQYKPQEFEKKIYQKWEESGVFRPAKKGKAYTIVMPPPNANASLHAGHAMYTVEDVLIRWKRMQGRSALWIPGMDHAGFETQFVFEKELRKKGKSRMDFDRQSLYSQVASFVDKNSGLIYQQFKKLGFSADWSRSVFTLDKKVLDRVFKTFKKMVEENLVYKDEYIVNYCTHCGTSLAELEVKHLERKDPLYFIKYGPLTLATVRPETKFGDTAVAVNPKDKRYIKWVGKEIEVQGLLGSFKLKVIADEYVDKEFGTGVVKITPYHDQNDFEVWKRHQELPQPIRIIDVNGRLTSAAEKYSGLKVNEARKIVAEDLEKAGLLAKPTDHDYVHSITVCYKCGRDLEPSVVPNWFIKVKGLKPAVVEAVKKNKTRFFPGRYKKQFLNWMEIMHDWPISRQIVWGIRIPIWYNIDGHESRVSVSFVNKKEEQKKGTVGQLLKQGYKLTEIKAGLQQMIVQKFEGLNNVPYEVSKEEPKKPGKWIQETDVFDTWFSSGQWPLVTINESEKNTRFPSDTMGTLADILKFWISRMMMFSLYLEKKTPFKDVYLWSMVADKKGQKMSKSKGNVINPIDLVDKYGADALRMAVIFGTGPGSKIVLAEDKVRAMRNLTNKIWNAARFVNEFLDKELKTGAGDQKMEKRMGLVIKKVNKQLDKYQLGLAAETVYQEFWHWFCDKKIEEAKQGKIGYKTIMDSLRVFLKLLHPFVPFVTEAVWQEMPACKEKMLITAKWPMS